MDEDAVDPVGDRRAGHTPRRVVRPEHEVVDEELRAPSEEVCQRGAALLGIEAVRLVDGHPRQLLTLPCHRVAAPRQLLLLLQEPEPGGQPLLACCGHVLGHGSSPLTVMRRREASFSQGAEWKALISKYIGTMPVSGDAERSMSGTPPRSVTTAMMAKVGAAASDSHSSRETT